MRPDSPTCKTRTGDSRQTRLAGFSLLELVIVLVLIGIMAAIGLGRFSGSAGHQSLEAAAQRVIADIELARQKALALSKPRTVTFVATTSTYTLDGMADLNRAGQTYTVSMGQAPYETNLTALSLDGSGGATLTFNGWGLPVLASSSSTAPYVVIGARGCTIIIALDPSTGRSYVASTIPSTPAPTGGANAPAAAGK